MDCMTAGDRAGTGAGGPDPAAEGAPSGSASLCMTCKVRTRCLGGIAAEAGTAQLQAVLAGRRNLRPWEVLYRPGDAFEHVFAVRSGTLKSSLALPGGEQVLGFHFAGELVGVDGLAGGQHRVTLTALDAAQLCAVRFAPGPGLHPGAGSFMARLWDMVSCELVRESAHRSLLALAPRRRVAAFLAGVRTRTRKQGLPPALSEQDVASCLDVPVAAMRDLPG